MRLPAVVAEPEIVAEPVMAETPHTIADAVFAEVEEAEAFIATDEAAAAPVAPPETQEPPDHEQVGRWLRLLHASGPALFKLWSLELADDPGRLPEILAQLTADQSELASAVDPSYQRALAKALDEPPPVNPEPAPLAEPQEDLPDWMGLREAAFEHERGATSSRSGGGA